MTKPDQIYDPMEYFREKIIELLEPVLNELKISYEIHLEKPPSGMGDFSYPCFQLAKIQKKSPKKIAKEIHEALPSHPDIEYDVKGPYLNFHITNNALVDKTLGSIFSMGANYRNHPKKGAKIILEHTSANPTDRLHVGRARNPIIGDTLARILRCAGFDVETQYYVDDMGKQTARKILELRYPNWDKTKFKTGYQWATAVTTESSDHYNANKAEELEIIMDGLESGNIETLKEAENVCKLMMDDMIIPTLSKINVKIDKYVNESKFMLDNTVTDIIDKLKNTEYCDIEAGAYYIDLTTFDVKSDKDKFFFLRADGKSLYATRDIAYHHWKFKNCDIAINILGEDHKLESEYVRVGLQLTGGCAFPENIFYAFVNLPEGRMSTRKGKVVYMDELVDEAISLAVSEVKKRRDDLTEIEIEKISEIVGIGAVRYNLVRVQAEKKIVFRWEDAINFEGDSAPFVQYAHARACSILRKADAEGKNYVSGRINSPLIENVYELDLVRILGKLPGIVNECAKKRATHILAGYVHETAAAFNQFYRECPVLQAESDDLIQSRLSLVDATRIVLKNAMDLLGIIAPEMM
jgi:arginyl-tRNA synthetase